MVTPVAKYSASITRVDVRVEIIFPADVISKRTDQHADIVRSYFSGRGVLNSSTTSSRGYRCSPIGRSCHTEEDPTSSVRRNGSGYQGSCAGLLPPYFFQHWLEYIGLSLEGDLASVLDDRLSMNVFALLVPLKGIVKE